MFLAGLTPAAVGEIYGLHYTRIGQLARQWGLDSRNLRAGIRSVAAMRPDLAREFVAEVAPRRSARGPAELTLGSGTRITWRCSSCSHVWTTSVANRALRGSGCPACARARLRTAALRDRARTPSIALMSRHLEEEFVRNVSVPDRDAFTTPAGSHDRVLWRCRRGHEWEAEARQRVKHRTSCPDCRPGFRSSRLEYEVAELLIAATGLTVIVGHVEPRTDRDDVERIDLYVEEIDLLVDLDPQRWHRSRSATDRDKRKLQRLSGRRYVRVRSAVLGLLDAELPDGSHARQVTVHEGSEADAAIWVAPLLRITAELGRGAAPLTEQLQREARGRAARRWLDLHHDEPQRSLLTEHPEVAAELVEVCERTGLTAADIAPAGNDRVRWRCRTCGHTWTARTANRTVLGTGCPPCRYRAGGRTAARPRPGHSFADRNPALRAQFIRNLTHPGIGLDELKPGSGDLCVWRCPYCEAEWRTTPQARNRRPQGGCRCRRGRRTVPSLGAVYRP